MNQFYKRIKERNMNLDNRIAVVLEGAHAGERVFVSGGRVVWEAGESGMLHRMIDQIQAESKSGILESERSRVYCECIGSRQQLVVCGAGHVSVPVIQIGKALGFCVFVLEDRPKFADSARKAGADAVICEPFGQGLNRIQGSPDTFFVIVTRGHKYDSVCLELAVKKPNAYIGMMGSRRRVEIVKKELAEQGVKREILDKVYTPIGLAIGAETPEEIAVSVMAEIIQVKNSRKRCSSYEELLIEELSEPSDKRRRVLATIVSRKGSAPREVGTKMLVMEDGTIIGTIGGGCAESEVIKKGLLMMRDERSQELLTVDMTGREAEEAGMVCGGTIEVLLENIRQDDSVTGGNNGK